MRTSAACIVVALAQAGCGIGVGSMSAAARPVRGRPVPDDHLPEPRRHLPAGVDHVVSDGGTPEGADVLPTTTMATKNARHIGSTVPAPTMPGFVRGALAARGLTDAYEARPKYQQTEYLTSVHAAKLNDEKRKRMNVMLDELAAGNVFQGKPWTPPEPTTK